jgi:spermidine dehydrogenase
MSELEDLRLGMDRPIARRDFLSGVGLALTGTLAYPWYGAAAQAASAPSGKAGEYYPPALRGLRGSHDGSWEVAHALHGGRSWDGEALDTGETYDLVVVGGGISGLAAAYFFRKAVGPAARILVLDNHDDFGGHAKRNEFRHGRRLRIGYGGAQSIDGPARYSAQAKSLLVELGIDVRKFYRAFDRKLYDSLGLRGGTFFDRQTFGTDRLVVVRDRDLGKGSRDEGARQRALAARAPFSEKARKDFLRLYEGRVDYMKGLSEEEKRARLRKISYAAFLKDYARVDPQVIAYFQQMSHGWWGVGIDAISALELLDYPGFQGMHLSDRRGEGEEGRGEPYIFHFPDGNASVARLLVRSLVPGVAPGKTMEDVVTAHFNYARLDEAASAVRIRLNSTAVRVRHVGPPNKARELVVTYVCGGKARKVRARQCVLACYHTIIPYLCPELPKEQRAALAAGVKVPLVYVNVLLRDWRAFEKLGVQHVYCPGAYFSSVALDFPVSLGAYRHPRKPTEPMVVHLERVPCKPGLPKRAQNKLGRMELLATTFETFECAIRGQLARVLSEGGFDPARDIEAITVNRWPHGYADEGDTLTDPEWKREEDKPWVLARRRFGRIAIANSDAARRAFTDAAIDEAHRAVRELVGG